MLWLGDVWLKWLVGIGFVFAGGVWALAGGRVLAKLAAMTPPNAATFGVQLAASPIAITLLGLLYVAAAGITA